jgi:anhydro-N-acetylmuramic acid kinase
MDAFVQKHFGVPFDHDAEIASKGKVSETLLTELKKHEFFKAPLPKTTGPEVFNLAYLENALEKSNTTELSKEDIMATLCQFTSETITDCIFSISKNEAPSEVFMSGGGMHNPLIVSFLKQRMPNTKFLKTDDIGIDGDAKEAVLFSTLANEALCGGETDFGMRKGVPSVSMGKVSFPN